MGSSRRVIETGAPIRNSVKDNRFFGRPRQALWCPWPELNLAIYPLFLLTFKSKRQRARQHIYEHLDAGER